MKSTGCVPILPISCKYNCAALLPGTMGQLPPYTDTELNL
jgi:hypothetical protein